MAAKRARESGRSSTRVRALLGIPAILASGDAAVVAGAAILAAVERAWDCAVVGLGAMGSATLWQAAARGARVIGVDRFDPPHDRGSSHGERPGIRSAYF